MMLTRPDYVPHDRASRDYQVTKTKNVGVLIAEDNPLVTELIHTLLERKGYRVVGFADNGLQAIEMTERLRPDVVVMDIHMPDMDGITAARHISQQSPTPVVMLTAFEDSSLLEQAGRAGVGAYLLKPPNAEELDRAITIALARSKDIISLRERNEELDAFAHSVAHDLKNPLSVLIGVAEFLVEDHAAMPADELEDHLNSIISRGRKAVSIVDDLLLLSSIRTDQVSLEPLDMAAVVAEAQDRLEQRIVAHHATLVLPETWPVAVGYPPWVEQVWVNYIDNAIKYGGRPPVMRLGSDTLPDGRVKFWVHDNGNGLTRDEQLKLFVPLTRLNHLRVQGYGLGLSIVRRIVEKLDGYVGVESPGLPGQGCRFFFVLPSADSLPPE
jgi:two-component system sensor histidine kinase/response regulator